MQLKHGLRV
jgi:hypothetical protein